MDMTSVLCECISNSDTDKFLSTLNQILKEHGYVINHDEVLKSFSENENFDLRAKLTYAYTFRRTMYKSICEEVVKSPYSYPRSALYFIASKDDKLRKPLIDILCFRVYSMEDALVFMRWLEAHGLSDWYHNMLVSSFDMKLKIHYVLYVNDLVLNEFFTSPLELAKAIVNCSGMNDLYATKGDALLRLSQITKDSDTLMYIKEYLAKVVLEVRNRLSSITDDYRDITGIEETEEEKRIREERDQQVLSYYRKQFEENTGIEMK